MTTLDDSMPTIGEAIMSLQEVGIGTLVGLLLLLITVCHQRYFLI